jgi:hypothetical protein
MFISAEKIIELIQAANDCEEKLPEAEQWIHVSDIAATLQKLIDDEEARLETLADQWHGEEWVEIDLGREPTEKELEVDFNWPHGV